MDCASCAGGAFAGGALCCLIWINLFRYVNMNRERIEEPVPTVIPNSASTENLAKMCKSASCQELAAEELPSEEQ